jgi:hypothetical protein
MSDMTEQGKTDASLSGVVNAAGASPAAATSLALAGHATRRRYERPTIVVFGSVEEFTRGTGTANLDANRVSRQVRIG